MRSALSFLLGFGLIAFASAARAQTPTATPVDCDAVRCQVQAAIAANCSCDGGNHGQFVSCVARTIKHAAVPRQCRGKVVSCVARSTCGKPGFETCQRQRFGTCNTTTGTCTKGTLASGLTACTANTDCLNGTMCGIVRAFAPHATPTPGADRCTLLGGTPGSGSCCAACP